jgi:shikimate kinase
VIADLVKRDGLVLATGGGAILPEQNREALRQGGIVIYLKASVHDLWQRTRHDKNRPLLQTADPHAKLTELFLQRDPLYQSVADIVMQSGRQSVHSLMLRLTDEVDHFMIDSQQSDQNNLLGSTRTQQIP